jgi:hypothetical protein
MFAGLFVTSYTNPSGPYPCPILASSATPASSIWQFLWFSEKDTLSPINLPDFCKPLRKVLGFRAVMPLLALYGPYFRGILSPFVRAYIPSTSVGFFVITGLRPLTLSDLTALTRLLAPSP